MAGTNRIRVIALGLVGGVLGGAAGYFIYSWLISQGFYALAIPPAMLGLGAGLCARGSVIARNAQAAASSRAVAGMAEPARPR